jgi:D-alanyl-D-alanine carboxypeptidase
MIIDFEADIEDYEEYMNPTGEDRDKYLVIASKTSPLGDSYVPNELYSLDKTYCYNENANQMTFIAAKALEAMLTELWADTGDLNIVGTSGYRSYSRQKTLFDGYVADEMSKNPALSYDDAKKIVLKYSAAAGTSEHQTGLCMDLVDLTRGDVENYSDTGCFTDRDTYEWLLENSWKFGYVLRYPEGKEDITGYSFESWHYRYVGRYHAERIYRSGLTLDEYVKTLD